MSNTSFLPEDYLDQRAERRTNLISLTLFAIVMISVFAAFLVTNREWSEVKSAQRKVNDQYQQAASQIEMYNELEAQKQEMLSRAELAAALVERVPRSILLAGLINRRPHGLKLTMFDLKSDRVKVQRGTKSNESPGQARRSRRSKRAPEVAPKSQEPRTVEVHRYNVTLVLEGVAPTDQHVSQYLSQLNGYQLLEKVNLRYTQEQDLADQKVRKFRIEMALTPEADVREEPAGINPLRGTAAADPAAGAGGSRGG